MFFLPKEAVNIKGTRQGLVILFDSNREFEDIKAGLKNKMESSRGFFNGAKFILYGEKKLYPAEKSELEAICKQYGLIPNPETQWTPFRRAQSPDNTSAPEPLAKKISLPGEETLLVKRTLRSGQMATHFGHITILGDVHPGAKVIAGGHVIVMGNCSGFIHAGSNAKSDAFIIALSMQNAQLHIADKILLKTPGKISYSPVIAQIKQNEITLANYINK